MDDKIDQSDADYVTRIIAGTASATRFADANNDGKINQTDTDQIDAIIAGTATQIALLDGNGNTITVSLPVNRIIVEYIQNAELVRVLGLESKVVGVDYCVDKLKSIYFPENAASIVSVGQMYTPDYETVLSLNPDVLLTFSNTPAAIAEKASKLPGVDVVFLGLYYPNVTNPEDSAFFQGILKAGYIFNNVPKATEYANWLLSLTQTIRAKTSTLTESQKQTVLLTNYPYTASTTIKAYATIDTLGQVCILSGGANIAASLPTYLNASSVNVDAEWIIQQDPDYIFLHTVHYTFSGITYADPAQGLDVNDITSIRQCLQNYTSQPMFANLKAVKNNHVYIILLHDRWAAYSSKPVGWMHIVPITDDGVTIANSECWFYGNCSSTEYWNWIQTYEDLHSINEWRYTNNYGVGIWQGKINSWNEDIYITETFNKQYTETAQLIDCFGSHMKFFFWWMGIVPEPIPDTSAGAPEPYIYFESGSQAHGLAWAHLQKKLWGNCWGSKHLQFRVATEGTSDYAYVYQYGNSITFNPNYDMRLETTFNIDMDDCGATTGTRRFYLNYLWVSSTGRKLCTFIQLNCANNRMYIGIGYYEDSTYTEWICPTPIWGNVWYKTSLRRLGTTVYLDVTYWLPDGSTGTQNIFADTTASYTTLTFDRVYMGTNSNMLGGSYGAMTKCYNGDTRVTQGGSPIWYKDWETSGHTISGMSLYYSQPTYVGEDDLWTYDLQPHWLLNEVKSSSCFKDDFNDGNYNGWTVYSGTWSIQNYKLRGQGSDAPIYTNTNFPSDRVVQSELRTETAGGTPWAVATLMIKWVDMQNQITTRIFTDGTIELIMWRNGNNVFQTQVSSALSPYTAHIFTAAVIGTNIKVWIDGILRIDANSAYFDDISGAVGYQTCTSAYFDDMIVNY